MPLTTGTRIGPYEITAALGAGGMGEVYRARDTRLKRDVALKLLPESYAADPQRLARFQREAEVLASLDHPHIGAIYGIEDSGETRALVLQLVEGETLAERIARGPIPLADALPMGRQIAEALEAAHEQGVVHRDLKPANVKITPEGVVKVLDFGLAKLTGPPEGGHSVPASRSVRLQPDQFESPTITTPALMTGAGMLLGTAAYMSPEQAKGRPADKRSDVWAFGCVLYEMLTGRRAFPGEDVADTLAAVLRGEPDWNALPADASPLLRLMLRRCLDKSRAQRPGDVAAIRFALTDEALATSRTPAVGSSTSRSRRWLVAAATVLAGASLAIGAWALKPLSAPVAVTRFTHTFPEGEVVTDAFFPSMAMSHDGSQLVYMANQRLYLRRMSEARSVPIAGTQVDTNIGFPVFSPDGRSVAFWVRTGPPNPAPGATIGEIRRAPIDGGTPLAVARVSDVPLGLSWYGEELMFSGSGRGVMRVSANGGDPELIAKVAADEQLQGVQLLPGGAAVLFTVRTGPSLAATQQEWDDSEIVVQSLASGDRKSLLKGSDARYLPTGHLLFARQGVLFAVPFDISRLETSGSPVPVFNGVRRATVRGPTGEISTGGTQFALSDTGTAAYLAGPPSGRSDERLLMLVDQNGRAETLGLPVASYETPRGSPDGKRLAVVTSNSGRAAVFIYDLVGESALRRLTLDGNNRFPVWSPDGQRVAFQSDREGDLAIFSQRADGTTAAVRLTRPASGVSQRPVAWMPDGTRLLVVESQGEENTVKSLSLADRTATPFGGIHSRLTLRASVSPDGRWVAYTTSGGEQAELFLQPYPATGAVYQVAAPGRFPAWSPDGRQLFYARAGQLWSAALSARGGATIGNPVPLSREVVSRLGPAFDYDVMADGRFVTAAPVVADFDRQEIQIVLNWTEELKRLVPAN